MAALAHPTRTSPMRKAADGRRHSEGLNPDKKNQAIILLGVLIAVWILSRFIHK